MTVTAAALAETREILRRAGRPIPNRKELVIMAEIRAALISMDVQSDADAPPKEK